MGSFASFPPVRFRQLYPEPKYTEHSERTQTNNRATTKSDCHGHCTFSEDGDSSIYEETPGKYAVVLENEPKHKNNKQKSNLRKSHISWQFTLPSHLKYRVLTLIVFGYYFALFLEESDPVTWRMLSSINKDKEKKNQEEVFKYIDDQLKPFLQIIPSHLRDSSDLSKLFPFLHEQHVSFCDSSSTFNFDCQIHVFHHYTGTFLESFPEKYDETKRQIHFVGEKDESGQLINLSLIQNLTTFFRIYGVFCFFCKKFFRGRGTQHKCKGAITCFACRRPLLKTNTYVNKKIKLFFCDSSLSASISIICSKCNMRILSPDCNRHHNQRVCRWGSVCQACGKYIFLSKFTPKEKILEMHTCGVHQCYFCGLAEAKKEHICRMRLPSFDSTFTNLAFLNFEFSGSSPSRCLNCFKETSNCKFCEDNKVVEPVLCSLLIETEKRGMFDKYVFASNENLLTSPMSLPNQNDFVSNYLPPELKDLPLSPRSKTKFGKPTHKTIKQNIFNLKSGKSTIDRLFSFLMSKGIPNTTFLLNDDSHNCFEEIIKCLFHHGFDPLVFGNPRIFYIEIPSLDIRFLNMRNYIDISFFDLKSQYEMKPKFFPLRWIKKSYFNYVGKPPTLEDLLEFEDTTIVRKEKVIEQRALETPWKFTENLIQYSNNKTKVLAQTCLDFIKNSFECQKKIQECIVLNLERSKIAYVHPFNKPLFTKASYAYKLMCLYSPSLKDVRVVKPAISMQSSQGELEFCLYTKWKNPNLQIFTAWSPFGQKRFAESFPDYYIPAKKKCGYWNGCLVHGHKKEECFFKSKKVREKNMFNVDFKTAFENYERKKKKLLENHSEEIQEIEEVWQCQWIKKKQEDEEIRYFLSQIYKNPPLYRLDPRKAGKNFLTEF